MSSTRTLIFTAILLVAATAGAATFVVPHDRDLIQRADAIVIGSALVNYSRPNAEGGIETVTSLSIEQVLKGSHVASNVNVVEPGGVFGDRATIISGVPRFEEGKRMLLLLNRTGENRWAATELVLGKFTFETHGTETLLLRDENEIAGWDPDLTQHVEQRRGAARFLQYIRDEVSGRMPRANYFGEAPPAATSSPSLSASPSPRFAAAPNFVARANAFSASSYTMIMSGTAGGRWTVFPNAVNWFMGTTQEPGAPGGGTTAITTAFASWNNNAGSNVNYVYAGVDNGTHTRGLGGSDGANTILFERDLSTWGAGPFTCSGNSYGGTLGIGGVTNASGTHTGPNGETFWTTQEGDIEMNRGIANCTTLFNNGDWNTAVTHEFGHTLGFRHSDQNRSSNGVCSSDPLLECSSAAIMTAVVTRGVNGAMQPWDINAVRAVYPGTVTPPPPVSGTPSVDNYSMSADFDGDGKSDKAVYRPSRSEWWILKSTGGYTMTTWGFVGDIPVPADYDGDGKTDIAVWRPSDGTWWVVQSTGGTKMVAWGYPTDIPVPGDYDGDGKADFAVFRPSDRSWWISKSTGGYSVYYWGLAGDRPVPADYDGDGKTDVAVWRPSNGTWWVLKSTGGTTTAGWGYGTDIPVPGKFDADNKADFAIWRPSTREFWTSKSTGGYEVVTWGLAGDRPVVGDYNGDLRADYAVWRPSDGTWWVLRSNDRTTEYVGWGLPGDTPVSSVNGR